ncbi:acyl-CoA-binding domain-containing protein 3-like isoform X3 [Canna indica]|uniref:Acyl-CoA-binding domain-containing protein 3-like isoform X3 n=1 Tax=Canna indica TaxID=4628 RepID=A0AAQ3QPS9_9LILI|nr:acyl-CoA-binding domain-containing protein 3-like isoform X3 [Canna indica]
MDFYQELLLTAAISVLLALLIRKIAAAGGRDDEGDVASHNPEKVPLSASSVASIGQGVVLDLIEEEPEGKSSGDACGSGTYLAKRDRSEEGPDERVCGIDLEYKHIEEEVSTEVEVDAPRVEESSAKEDDFVQQEERFVEEPAEAERIVEKVVQFRGEDVVQTERAKVMEEAKVGSLLHGEDDWEGIERSELEKFFGVASEFVGSEKGGDAVSKLSNEVQMQLYGLHKVATEGPCYESQPMALKVSARSKWHAWQRLGNMNPEAAMEQYISLLTDSIPGWMADETGDEAKGHGRNDPLEVEVSQIGQHDSKSSPHNKSEPERVVGDSYPMEGASDIVATGPKLLKEGLTKLFLFNLISFSPTRVTF